MDTPNTRGRKEEKEARIKAWWGMFISPVFGRQRQEDYHKFEVHLAYTGLGQPGLSQTQTETEMKPEEKRSRDQLVAAGWRLPTRADVRSSPERDIFLYRNHDRKSTGLIPLSIQGPHFTVLIISTTSIQSWSWLCSKWKCWRR